MLVIYHAEPGTSSAEKLALLASLASPPAVVTRDAIPGLPAAPQPDRPGPGRGA